MARTEMGRKRHGHALRTVVAVVCAALAAGTLAGCGIGDTSANAHDVTLMVSTLNNPFFVDLRDGARQEARKLGVRLNVADAQNDSATEQNQAMNARAQGVGAVIINPVDSDAASPAVGDLLAAGMPVISVDRTVTGQNVTSHIASDNIEGGRYAAKALADAIGGKGEVIILEGTPGAATTRDRGKGFEEGIAEYSGIRVVAKQTANFDRTEALDVTSNLLQAHPDVVGVFAENDEMALGAVQALGDRAGKQVKVFGFDGTDEGLQAVKAGTMVGSIAQRPRELGSAAVKAAVKVINGGSVDKEISIPVVSVTRKNVADFLK